MSNRVRQGSALYLAVAAVAATGAFWAGMSLHGKRRPTVVTEPAPLTIAVALSRAGCAPHQLAAAGVSPSGVSGIVNAVKTALVQNQIDLPSLTNDVTSARQAADRAEAAVRSGDASESALAALADARRTFANANARLQSARDTIAAAATTAVTEATAAKIETIHGEGEDLPVQYRVIDRAESDTVTLRGAVADERIASGRGENPRASSQQAVGEASSVPAVANAGVALASNGEQVKAAWKQAIGLQR